MQTVATLQLRYSQVVITADIQQVPGDAVPPVIDGFRPDVYATLPVAPSVILAEAKTDRDLDRSHTFRQLLAFFNYLERKENGSLILSVTGCRADRAKTLLQFLQRSAGVSTSSTHLSVFDSYDLWSLDSTSEASWHLI